jgi:hypothetical protein
MAEFPRINFLPDPLIHSYTLSPNSLGSMPVLNGVFGASSYPTANLALFVPFRLTRPTTFNTLFIYQAGTASGNIDLGIYSADGTKLISTGSTANTTGLQSISITATTFTAGLYYYAVACDNTTNQPVFMSMSQAMFLKAVGMAQMASAFPLPATATFATIGQTVIPIIGATARSVI